MEIAVVRSKNPVQNCTVSVQSLGFKIFCQKCTVSLNIQYNIIVLFMYVPNFEQRLHKFSEKREGV